MSGDGPYDPLPDLARLLAAVIADPLAWVSSPGILAAVQGIGVGLDLPPDVTWVKAELAIREAVKGCREHDRQQLRDVAANARNAGFRL